MEKNGNQERMFIEANPQYKNLNVYDAKMQMQYRGVENGIRTAKETDMKKDKKESVKKEGLDDESGPEKSKKSSKRKGISV